MSERVQASRGPSPKRSSGVLLHPTSLPGGRFGPEAYRFVDWLVDAGQAYWQVLPLGPPDAFGSPYAGASAFAGWGGLLAEPDGAGERTRGDAPSGVAIAYWIDDWIEYSGDTDELANQVRFEREWRALHAYARRAWSADHRRSSPLRRARQRRRDGSPVDLRPVARGWRSAGPVHRDGPALGEPDVSLGKLRERGLPLVDRALQALPAAVRRDAARPLSRVRRVLGGPPRRPDGRARPLAAAARARALFDAVRAELGALPLIAEDLGHITPPVHRLREALGVPGMHILQWAFGDERRHLDRLSEPSRVRGRLHRDARQRHSRRLVGLGSV